MVLGNPFPVPFHPSLRNYLFRSIRRQIPKVWRGSVSLIGTHGFAKRRLYSLAPSFHLAIYICLNPSFDLSEHSERGICRPAKTAVSIAILYYQDLSIYFSNRTKRLILRSERRVRIH